MKKLLILPFLIAVFISPVRAQDLPSPPANLQTLTNGSYVIAMDNTLQTNSAGNFNLKTYGLVVYLLNNNVKLKWAIKAGKIKDGIDFTGTAEQFKPALLAGGSKNFKAGPFVIQSADTSGVAALIDAYYTSSALTGNNRPRVYRLTAAVNNVDIRYDLTGFHPKAAILNDGKNSDIHESYMADCAIPASNYAFSAGADLLEGCFTFASEPHNETSTNSTITGIKNFVLAGGNFLAECRAIDTYENSSVGHFQTTNGVTITNTDIAPAATVFPNADLSFSQFEGLFDLKYAGSMSNWVLAGGSSFTNNAYNSATGGTLATQTPIGASVSKLIAPGLRGGLVFFLGSHDFNSVSALASINGIRMYMNAFLTPVSISTLCQVTMALGNTVWLDANNNGIKDGAENGIANIRVRIYKDADGNNIPDGSPVDSTLTNASGVYSFPSLKYGNYIIGIVKPGGYSNTTTTVTSANPNNDTDNDNNGVNTSGNEIRSNFITLSVNGEPVTDGDGDNGNQTLDFGLLFTATSSERCFASPTIPNIVNAKSTWTFDAVNQTVTIRTSFAKTFVDNTYGTSAIGWPSGHTFGNLTGSDKLGWSLKDANGVEKLKFDQDYIGASASFPSGYGSLGFGGDGGSPTVGNAGDVVKFKTSLDQNFNGYGYVLTTNSPVTDAGYTPNGTYPNWIFDVWYEVTVKLSAFGSDGFGYPDIASVHASPSKTGNNTEIVNPRLCPGPLKLGNLVWVDTDNNGVKDVSENGIANIRVRLYKDADGNNIADGSAIDSTLTNANGLYSFNELQAGNYIAGVVIPGGYSITATTATSANPNNDTDNDNNGLNVSGNEVRSNLITLSINGEPVTDGDDNNGNLTLDFGLIFTATPGERCFTSPTKPAIVNAKSTWTFDAVNQTVTIKTTFAKTFVDNTYGSGAIGWPSGHTFGNLTGSDKLVWSLKDANGTERLNFGQDYISSGASTPSTYGTLGFNGDGNDPTVGNAADVVKFNTSLDQNFNVYNYVLTTNSPATDANYTPNGATPNWIYDVWYEVTIKLSAFGPAGFGYPDIASIHASPSKTGNNTEIVIPVDCSTPLNLGNLVWHDFNDNGIRDAGEPGISGATVKLYADANNDNVPDAAAIATTTTDANGIYGFTNLAAGKYIVGIVIPAGYILVSTNGGDPDNDLDNDNNGLTTVGGEARSNAITLTGSAEPASGIDGDGNNGNLTLDFALKTQPAEPCALSIHNPYADFNASSNPGTATTLWFNLHTKLTNSQLTANGDYILFTGGTLTFNGILTSFGSSASLPNGMIIADNTVSTPVTTFDVPGNTWITKVPLGYSSSDIFLSGAAITSTTGYSLSGGSKSTMLSGNFFSNKTITSSWFYGMAAYQPTFTNSTAGNINSVSGIPVAGRSAGTPTDQTAGLKAGGSGGGGSNFTGSYSSTDNYTTCLTQLNLGNLVWEDLNNNGLRDGGEPGISGATVKLYADANNDNIPDAAAIATTTTDANGIYNFINLSPGNYIVGVVIPAGYTLVSTNGGDPDNDIDNDNNGLTSIGGEARSNAITLTIGAEPNAVVDGDGTNGNLTNDFALNKTGAIGDFVWNDSDGDGVQDAGEPGIPGVEVKLYLDANHDCIADGAAIATTTTDANGLYLFSGLPAGNYMVVFPTTLPGYTPSPSNQGADDGKDSDPNVNGKVCNIELSAGETDLTIDAGFVHYLNLGNLVWEDYNNNGVRDPAEPGISNVTAKLYADANNDNIPDGAAIATTTTDANGLYNFSNLLPGNYIVGVVIPAGYVLVPTNGGDPDNDVDNENNGLTTVGGEARSNAVTLVGTSEPTTPVDGDDTNGNLAVDFALNKTGAIGDFVWNDSDGDGVQDAGEPGIPGVEVKLYLDTNHDCIADGAAIATTTTDANGLYLFSGLPAGNYMVVFPTTLPGYTPSPSNQGADDAKDSDPNLNGKVCNIELSAGETDLTIDAGFTPYLNLGNLVWEDLNNNGLRDDGEPGISGVTVKLYIDANNDNVPDGAAIATTTTDANGLYGFNNLLPGNYIVAVVFPDCYAMVTFNGGDPDNDTDNDNNGLTKVGGEARSNAVTLTGGGEPGAGVDGDGTNGNLTVDFALKRSAEVHITCPDPLTVQCASSVPAPDITAVTVNSSCGGNVTVTHDKDDIIDQTCANKYKVIRAYSAMDSYGNTATCTQTITVNDNTPPTFTFCPPQSDLGCNPTEFPAGNATATDNCVGIPDVTSQLNDPVKTGPCSWTRTRVYTATDVCGNTNTCTQTYIWTEVTAPQFSNCGQTYSLPCNSTAPTCASSILADGAVTATNECGSVPVNCSAADITSNGCNRQRILTFTATACDLTSTCTRIYNWTEVTAPQFSNCGQTYSLPCNSNAPTCASSILADGAVTATNECGSVPVNCSAADITSNGCNRQRILTFTATACDLTSTCTRIYNWTEVTAPQFSNCGQTYSLPCNSTAPTCASSILADGAVTATNECGSVPVNCSAADITSNGCNRQRILTFTATACELTSTCTRIYNWTEVTAPQFSNCGQTYSLPCNSNAPTCASSILADGAVTATNECGSVPVNCSEGLVTSNGCNRQRILTFTATACNLTSTCTRIYNWTEVTAPQFSNCGQTYSLPCNSNAPTCASSILADGAVTATNECGSVPVNCSAGDITSNGCNRQRILTFTATACDLTSTCTRIYNWTEVTAPQFSNCGQTYSLPCNSTAPTCASSILADGAVTATNECSSVPVNCSAADITSNGCNRQRILTFTATACELTSTCTRIYNWTEVTAPQFSNCGQTYSLPCNSNAPTCASSILADGAVTATNECGSVPVNCSAAEITSNGCNRQRILTFTATACDLTSTCTRIYNWTEVTAPKFSNCGQTYSLPCNSTAPTCASSILSDGAVTATNECGTVLVNCSEGTVTSDGCNRQRILTFTATQCNLTSTCTRVYNWSVAAIPQLTNCGQNYDLGCNPTIPTCDNYSAAPFSGGAVTATSECGLVPVFCSASEITSNGCNRQRILTFTATICSQTNSCTRIYNWTEVTAPQFSNCGQTYSLPCNSAAPTCASSILADGAVTATNECGSVPVNCSEGLVTSNGCNRQRILTFTATACNLTSTCTRIYNWTEVTAPQFSNCGQTYSLPCNSTAPTCASSILADGAVTATNECGSVPVNCSEGTVTSNGCNRQRILTFTATACDLTSTCTRIYNWIEVTAPQFSNCGQTFSLPCNSTAPTCASSILADGTITATNECGSVPVNCSEGTVTSNGCNRQRILTFTATACDLTSTCTRIYNWTEVTAPQFSNCGQTYSLPCNSTAPTCASSILVDGAVTATNECGSVPVNCSEETVTSDGCNRQRILTFTATQCNLTSTCTRIYNWSVAAIPQLTNCGQTYELGCNPTIPTCDNYSATPFSGGAVTATSECGSVPVICSASEITSDGCNRQRILTFTATICSQSNSCTRTYNWTEVTAPKFSNCGQTFDIGCNPTTYPDCGIGGIAKGLSATTVIPGGPVTATNECGFVPVFCDAGVITSNGCNRQRILTYTATSCNLTSTCTRIYNWTEVTAPQFSNCGQTFSLPCNSTAPTCASNILADGAVTATNECGSVPVNCSAGDITSDGCNRQRILTFTATQCNLTSTCTRIYNWTEVTAPQFRNCGQTYSLPCNSPAPTCASSILADGAVTATNECGSVPVNCSAGDITSNGCNRQRILTFTATACDLTSTCTRIYNWTEVTAPQFSNCGQTYSLPCNSTAPTCASSILADGAVTATNECGSVPVNCSAGDITSDGCNRQRILTFTATQCNLTSTCTRIYNWSVAAIPQLTNCGQIYDLGCNPTIPTCDNYSVAPFSGGVVTATSECGSVPVICSASEITSDGCNRQRILTFTATICSQSNSCTRTYNWTEVTAPHFSNCGQTYSLPCNSPAPTCASSILAAGAVTATNECGSVPVNCSVGDITSNGCNRQRILTFTATQCNLTSTCTRIYNWSVAAMPQLTNCGQSYELGCNPTIPTCDNYSAAPFSGGAITATSECGSVPVICSASEITSNGCNRQRILTFTATICSQSNSCTRTYNWTEVTAPQFSNCGQTFSLPCNSTAPTCASSILAAGAVTATNECGTVSVNCSEGTITSNGCNRQRILTFTATQCNLTSTCTRIYNWTVVTEPKFSNCGQVYELGVAPSSIPTCSTYMNSPFQGGAVTATNECGTVDVSCSAGPITSPTACTHQVVLTFTATACGLTSTCTRTYNWSDNGSSGAVICNNNTIVIDQNVTVNFNTATPTYSGDPDLLPYFAYNNSGATPDLWKAIFNIGANKLLIKNGATITTTKVNGSAPGIQITGTCTMEIENNGHIIVLSANQNAGNIDVQMTGNILVNGEVRNEVTGTLGLPGAITIVSKNGNITEGQTGIIQILGIDPGANLITLQTCGSDCGSNGDITLSGLVKSYAHAHAGDLTKNRPNINVISLNGAVTINANTAEPLYDEFASAGGLYDIYGGLLSWVRDNVNPGFIKVQAKKDITVNGHGIDPTSPVRTSFGAIAAISTGGSSPGGNVDVRSLEGKITGNDRAFDVSGRNRLSTNFAYIRLYAKQDVVLRRLGANNNFNPVVNASAPGAGDNGGTNELRSYSGKIDIGANAVVSAAIANGNPTGTPGMNFLTSCSLIVNAGTVTPADANTADDVNVCSPASPAALFTSCIITDVPPEKLPLHRSSITEPVVRVYPNPSRGLVNVVIEGSLASRNSVSVMDITGRVVHDQIAYTNEGQTMLTLDLSNLAKGVYMISVRSGNFTRTTKLLLE